MKQSKKTQKRPGSQSFHEYYKNLFGDRWQNLCAALLEKPDSRQYKVHESCEPYFLDSASIRSAISLPLSGAEHILDLCAAPGGKTIVLASLMGENAQLLSNERSGERKIRLQKSCDSCLPPSVRERVTVTNKDGAVLCRAKENIDFFDAILLDAPCSSERHVLGDKKYLDEWSPARIKTLSMAQWSLLSSAWRMLSPGGHLLYSTCALSPAENDDVIARLLKKFPDALIKTPEIAGDVSRFTKDEFPAAEKTEFGAHILPDRANGAGPLYFSLVQKP